MITGDAAYIKKINRSLILEKIVEEGMISRADISKATALTRATVSAQVADLLDDGLIIETQLVHNTVGRKPIMLSLNANAGYALGIDVDYEQISFTISDLLGNPVSERTIECKSLDYDYILQILIEQINLFDKEFNDNRYGIIGVVIAIHGLVGKDEKIHFVPRFLWRSVDLKADLEKACSLNIQIENNANISAFAERVFHHHETNSLLCATIYSGIGLGMIVDNHFFRGNDGFAGEIGHMIVVPHGRPCSCGNEGCWEQYASETVFLQNLKAEKNLSSFSYDDLQKLIEAGDKDINESLDQFIYYLSIGLNNMINMYNPDTIVLDGEILRLYPDAIEKIEEHLTSTINHYRQLTVSSFGKRSVQMGACALAIKRFLGVPMINLTYKNT
ncbi:ROK family transcriptional regulator [Bacillus sp. REN16]|uniref:ROK family transcriptional regulator n=1 Tax=Bacillus sp. REN16 TaxID=2887296 RepID=UPI001E334EB7|nr:ROK family transcriptional regulator [Bacillus sp. REN16]MCC3358528.1 ROK family transcriptional regulator [Bacillus sp. REN16]